MINFDEIQNIKNRLEDQSDYAQYSGFDVHFAFSCSDTKKLLEYIQHLEASSAV